MFFIYSTSSLVYVFYVYPNLLGFSAVFYNDLQEALLYFTMLGFKHSIFFVTFLGSALAAPQQVVLFSIQFATFFKEMEYI
jgi:hypothetical protein